MKEISISCGFMKDQHKFWKLSCITTSSGIKSMSLKWISQSYPCMTCSFISWSSFRAWYWIFFWKRLNQNVQSRGSHNMLSLLHSSVHMTCLELIQHKPVWISTTWISSLFLVSFLYKSTPFALHYPTNVDIASLYFCLAKSWLDMSHIHGFLKHR